MPDESHKKVNDTLRLRRVAIDTYRENVAYLHRECEIYRAEGFQALSKVEIGADDHRILAVLNVVDDVGIVTPAELGLSEQAFTQLGLEDNSLVRIAQAEPPASMDAVRRKVAGERLDQSDYNAIGRDIADSRYSKTEMAAFLVASGETGLDRDEALYLTRSMVLSGERLDWNEPLVADKHCIGGIPGNRTSMLVVPIVAAHGMLIPKTSSRAITSPAGTADTMEVLAKVEHSPDALRQIVHRARGCIAWGGTARLAPVDDMLISVQRPLGVDSMGQMVASILAKKIAAGSTHLLLDIPVGPTAKVRSMRQALQLRKLFEFVGDELGLHLEVIITDGRQPIGRGIGPVLEARDVMQVLENDPNAPADLRQNALRLAGRVLEFDPDVRGGRGFAIARDILDSGRALAKMNDIIERQGRQGRQIEVGPRSFEVLAPETGTVTGIDNLQLARIARMAGAPMDMGAGVDLFKKLGDPVTGGERLYRVHAAFRADYKFAKRLTERSSGYTIGTRDQIPKPYVD
ncbi:MAG: thymidine phosphorylase family protein [Gammaproteobacteria bacterium]|nr:thymidine phosphorylase family protein [Gammaproteobacteria bacterium]NIR97804.1 thymidine phosphorylase family protein [Gammaproteobacteria bacterium]NIT63504.1 thymidine phosphorylase family protein [Gammaproteobacteria bacterium]NIV20451.1 thymidine phosphorylase [Gammaproteobacteria bacterium]NIX11033.1 thymidine phosphorylase [Gammaproteobacteria bacterium]